MYGVIQVCERKSSFDVLGIWAVVLALHLDTSLPLPGNAALPAYSEAVVFFPTE